MGNMGYCRFRNTLRDLDDCLDHINDSDMGTEEFDARNDLIQICKDIIAEADEGLEIEEEEDED